MHKSERGIAIISTLLFLGLMFMMAVSMIASSRQRAFTGMSQHNQSQALYLAEAGLAKSQESLELDVTWSGTVDEKIPGMRGSYSVRFDNTKLGSVNNINNAASTGSYRGPGTVPANSALLIVVAEVAGQTYVLESLVEGQGAVAGIEDALLASGKIEARGDLLVDGITALDDSTPVDGNIQSNSPTGGDRVVWDGSGSALVTGSVGSGSSGLTAINMPGATINGGQQLNSVASIPSTDVATEVANNMGHDTPVWVAGGTTELDKPNYSISGDQLVNGDIVLKGGVTLYVNGEFQVNGTIRGEGSVYVNGDTIFKGDSSVNSNEKLSTSIYSEGNVKLTGFDGSDFLAAMDAETQGYLDDASHSVDFLQGKVEAHQSLNVTKDTVWNVGIALGDHSTSYQAPTINIDGRDVQVNTLALLKGKVDALPTGETRDFLSDRVDNLQKLMSSAAVIYPAENDPEGKAVDEFNKDGSTEGLLDAVATDNIGAVWPEAKNLIGQINYDKLGSSHFQGTIYTKGYFLADNEVSVLGAIVVDGDGTDLQTVTLSDGSKVDLASGDLYLGKKSRVTFVEEMFEGSDSNGNGPQQLERTLWMGR